MPAHIGLLPLVILMAADGNSLTVIVMAAEFIEAHVEF